MTKSDLRTGMVVTCKNGNRYKVMLSSNAFGEDLVVSENSYNFLRDYNDDLTLNRKKYPSFGYEYDIIKVQKPIVATALLSFDECCLKTIWERPEPKKKYTYAQLKEILGDEFEIVKT